MKYLKQIIALFLVCVFVFTMVACNKDEDTALTTKKKTTKNSSTTPAIDIDAYLNSMSDDDVIPTEVAGTVAYSAPSTLNGFSSGNTINYGNGYQDVAIDFGGSNVISNATTVAGGYPSFSWKAVPGAIRYNIYRSSSKDGTYSYIDATTQTSYTDKTAIKGKKYYYQVKAVKKTTVTTTTKPSATASTTKINITTQGHVATTTRNVSGAPEKAPVNYVLVSDIVAFYNASANNVKTNATSVTRLMREIKYVEDENNSETIKTLLALGGVKENTDKKPESYTTRDKIISEFPAENLTVSSTLEPSMVAAAKCTYSKGYYTVVIKLKNDPERTTEYSGTCMNILNAAKVYSAFQAETRGAILTAKIYYDGTLDYLDQFMPTYVYADYDGNDMSVHGQQALSIEEVWYAAY
ncbi:MAG: hypothetical protein PUD72_04635 [Oscillospiraceae bacterium]|nr:hypothetical protein [Oscillospiraceae bacterium]